MGLWSNSVSKRASSAATGPFGPEPQRNLVGAYVTALSAHRDTRALALDIKRANDAIGQTGVSRARFRAFLLDHIEEKMAPKDRQQARNQVVADFPSDAPGRIQLAHHEDSLHALREQKSRLQKDLLDSQQMQERHRLGLKATQREYAFVRSEYETTQQRLHHSIETLTEQLQDSQARCAWLEEKMRSAQVALLQANEPYLPTPRTTRPASYYGQTYTPAWRPPSLNAETSSLLFAVDSESSSTAPEAAPH